MSTLLLNWGKANAKDPDEITFYGLTWQDVIEADEDDLASYELTIVNNDTPGVGITPLAIDSHSVDGDGLITIWFSGGMVSKNYEILCHAVFASSQELDQTVILPVRKR